MQASVNARSLSLSSLNSTNSVSISSPTSASTSPNRQTSSKWDRLAKHFLLVNPNPAITSVVVVNPPITASVATVAVPAGASETTEAGSSLQSGPKFSSTLTTGILNELFASVITTSNGEVTTYIFTTSPVETSFYVQVTGKPAGGTGSPLSVGAIIGTTLGVAFGVAIFCGLALIFFFRRKKRRAKEKASIDENADTDVKAQLHSEDVKPVRKELQGDQPPEVLPGKGLVVAELPANEIVGSEMEARNH